MFKLIKWTVIGAASLGAAGYFLFDGQPLSYVRTAFDGVKSSVNDSIPVDFEIRRVEKMIQDIEPQIVQGKRQLVQAEVDLEQLQNQVARLERSVQKSERKLKAVSAALSSDAEFGVQLAGFTNRGRLEYHAERTLEVHKNNVELLKGKRALIDRQQRAVEAATGHLEAVQRERTRLSDMVAALKTQKHTLDMMRANTVNYKQLDDSKLAQAKQALEKLQKRITVEQRLLEQEMYINQDLDEFETTGNKNVLAEIEKYFAASDEGSAAPLTKVR